MSEERFVLISPVGTTDPISVNKDEEKNKIYHDGSLLHIVRHYMPKKVYLYYSKEIYDNYIPDGRCEKLLRMMDPDIEIEIMKRDIDPSDFDGFRDDFNYLINKASDEHPEKTIILNISSGTPQMKSTLTLEYATSNRKMKAVQVTTPIKRANKDIFGFMEDDDIKGLMMKNRDNLDNAENRCIEPNIKSVRLSLIKSQIKSLISIYDYEGAYRLSKEFGNPTVEKLINNCRLRFVLKYHDAKNTIREYEGVDLFPVKDHREAEIIEYLSMLKIKQKRGLLTDLTIGLNPFLTKIMEEFLRVFLNIDTDKFYNPEDKKKISKKSIKSMDPGLLKYLNSRFGGNMKEDTYISIALLCHAIEYYGKKDYYDEVQLYKKLKNINNRLRNSSAHGLKAVSENEIRKIAKMSSHDLIHQLEEQVVMIYGIDNIRVFNLYDVINSYVLEELDKY